MGLRHSDSPLILKKTSCSWSFRVNSSSKACRGQQIQMMRSLIVEEGVGKLARRVKYLLPGPQLFPPLSHLQAVLLIQLLQLLCLMFDQEVTFLILQHNAWLYCTKHTIISAWAVTKWKLIIKFWCEGVIMCFHLQLLQLPDVGVTLQLQIPHLVLVFLVLMQTLVFLPLFFLSSKLNQSTENL